MVIVYPPGTPFPPGNPLARGAQIVIGGKLPQRPPTAAPAPRGAIDTRFDTRSQANGSPHRSG